MTIPAPSGETHTPGCRSAGKGEPRVLRNRHADGCVNDRCTGCEPCTWPHCRVCGTEHAEHTCPTCLGTVRDGLSRIRTMCETIRTEATHRGPSSEAMNLLGPVPNPEARKHAEASYLAGRLPEGWLETGKHGKDCPLLVNEPCTGCGGGDLHPLTMAWWWNECYREAFDHAPTPMIGPRYSQTGIRLPDFGVVDLIDYLTRNLSYASTYPDVAFDDFAAQVARCVAHMEQVLHAGEQIETGAPCQRCRRPVTVTTGVDGNITYRCDRCNRDLGRNEYASAVQLEYVKNADRLNADDLADRLEVPVSSIRRWANVIRIQKPGKEPEEIPALIRSCGRDGKGRKVYKVAEALRIKHAGDNRRRAADAALPSPRE